MENASMVFAFAKKDLVELIVLKRLVLIIALIMEFAIKPLINVIVRLDLLEMIVHIKNAQMTVISKEYVNLVYAIALQNSLELVVNI
jgi:hypothetical protein